MKSSVSILKVRVTTAPEIKIKEKIKKSLDLNRTKPWRRLIFTPNSEMLSKSAANKDFEEVLNKSWLNIPDGWGVVWASNGKIKERITGVDLMEKLVVMAGRYGWKVFLLGSEPGVAQKAIEKLRLKIDQPHRNFRLVESPGPKSILTANKKEVETTIREINKIRPNFLFVGFGHSKQEFFLTRYKNDLWFDYAMGVGGAFDMISGLIKRAPLWIQKSGLEWLWRLVAEPKRWKRQILIFKFPLLVAKSWFKSWSW